MGGVIIDARQLGSFEFNKMIVIDGTNGGWRHLWADNIATIKSFINAAKLKPIETQLFLNKKEFRWPVNWPGIPVPHLHFNDNLYQLTEGQWKQFTGNVMKDLQGKLAKANNVGLDQLDALSGVVRGL